MSMDHSRIETELHHEEGALRTELERLAQVSDELQGRLKGLYAKGQALNEPGLLDHGRLQAPRLDGGAALAKAQAAREVAIRARQEIAAALREQLAQAKGELRRLSQLVLDDERRIEQLEAQARQRALAPPPPPKASPPPALVAAPAPRPAEAPARPNRQRPRVQMQAAIDLQSDDNFFNGFSSNISDGGLFVATVNLVPLGTEVDLSFSLPSGVKVQTKGVVRWVRVLDDKAPEVFPGLGVQFKDLDPAAQGAINQFLAEREPLFYAE